MIGQQLWIHDYSEILLHFDFFMVIVMNPQGMDENWSTMNGGTRPMRRNKTSMTIPKRAGVHSNF